MALAGIWKQHFHTLNQHSQICVIAKFPKIIKMPYLGIFGIKFNKNYDHIWKQHPLICLIAKFRGNTKMAKFETKNALLG